MKTETSTELAADRIRESLAAQERLLEPEHLRALAAAADAVADALAAGGKVLLFGNGGSAADATHIAAELVGRFLLERRALPAISLSDNVSALTAIANDYEFAGVFARQIEAFGEPGDVAIGITTSGRSANVVRGLETARERGLRTIALTGGDGGDVAALSDICLCSPAGSTARVQEAHILVAHVLCELVERRLA
jgi:D-sedoheptulose 7-phosphate isomerase